MNKKSQQIKDCVKNNNLEEAISLIISSKYTNEAIMLSSRIEGLNKLIRTGQISEDHKNLELNKIRNSILEVAKKLESQRGNRIKKNNGKILLYAATGIIIISCIFYFAEFKPYQIGALKEKHVINTDSLENIRPTLSFEDISLVRNKNKIWERIESPYKEEYCLRCSNACPNRYWCKKAKYIFESVPGGGFSPHDQKYPFFESIVINDFNIRQIVLEMGIELSMAASAYYTLGDPIEAEPIEYTGKYFIEIPKGVFKSDKSPLTEKLDKEKGWFSVSPVEEIEYLGVLGFEYENLPIELKVNNFDPVYVPSLGVFRFSLEFRNISDDGIDNFYAFPRHVMFRLWMRTNNEKIYSEYYYLFLV